MKLIYVAYGSILTVILGLSFVVMAQTIEITPVGDIYEIAATKYATSTMDIAHIEQLEDIMSELKEIRRQNEAIFKTIMGR